MPMSRPIRDFPLRGDATTSAGSGANGSGGRVLWVDRVRLGYWGSRGFHLAVEEASFDVAARERVVVIGQSGSGKSTLLKAVAGFVVPAGGAITVAGRTSLAPGPDRAVVFQEFDQLFPWRTVHDNVAYPLRVNGWRRKDAGARARDYVELTGLSHAADRYPHELSGGMKQRVAIARALALEPVILLMDEPFGSLDAITRARLQRELRGILERTSTTLFFVTHSIDEALILGERVIVLHGQPSTVREIVDVREVGEPDSPAYAEMRIHLRELLAIEEEDGNGDE
jgi:NitT/TauT family transport system ATP-binding protein